MQTLLIIALAVPVLSAILSFYQTSADRLRQINTGSSIILTGTIFMVVYQTACEGVFHGSLFYVDELSALLLLIVAILSLTAMLFSFSYMEREVADGYLPPSRLSQYYAMLNVFTFTMIGLLVMENMGLMWVAIEATTLASVLLVAFNRNRTALEAAWKYAMVCSVGICFALLGTILLYYTQINVTETPIEALSWLQLRTIGARLDPAMVKLAFIFIVIGYGTKAGLAPMHTWLPDAHSQAPSPVSGLLSGALLSCAMYVIIRSLIIVQSSIGLTFGHYLLVGFGLFSIAVAIPFILVQHDIKRLLAYSSVEHMGLVAVGLGIGTPLAVYGALLHIFNHAVTKSALFYLSGSIIQRYHTKHIMKIRGLLRAMPLIGTMFTLLIIAIVGMPPFSIFTSKLTIAWAYFQTGQYTLGLLLLLLLAGVFCGMIFYLIHMSLGAPSHCRKKKADGGLGSVAVMLSLVLAIGGGFYIPAWLNQVLVKAAALVTGG